MLTSQLQTCTTTIYSYDLKFGASYIHVYAHKFKYVRNEIYIVLLFKRVKLKMLYSNNMYVY